MKIETKIEIEVEMEMERAQDGDGERDGGRDSNRDVRWGSYVDRDGDTGRRMLSTCVFVPGRE